jgi:excisionase family DNA binding protein
MTRKQMNSAAAMTTVPVLLTVEELMATLKLSRTKVYQLMNNAGLPHFKIDGSTRIPVAGLNEWLARHSGNIA